LFGDPQAEGWVRLTSASSEPSSNLRADAPGMLAIRTPAFMAAWRARLWVIDCVVASTRSLPQHRGRDGWGGSSAGLVRLPIKQSVESRCASRARSCSASATNWLASSATMTSSRSV